ncbi:biotin/lipoyl-containing protein [Meridianimarinicoccus sp. RP-17]|uniref:biotin/lipoyl-containing protein n=1 Tax=Meridianimarinicoccus zhengii TaxID=2056810 RepID=UPI000DADCE27|nr:biotin/lipoyl-containing protein [Phycocomes zhengii]
MPHEVIMPALGMAQDSGVLVAWLKSPGDPVKAGDALMEVETDKATMEVEAAHDGYLTDLQATEGEAVPVGNVVALISETPEGSGNAPRETPAQGRGTGATDGDCASLPEGRQIIMPALGMAQDSALIVGWSVKPGDKVGADDVLLEVETDKSTMEVPAGHDGYLAAVLAAEGEDVPVGEVIAIISAEKPDTPVQRTRADAPAPVAAPAAKDDAPAQDAPEPAPAKTPTAAPQPAPAPAAGDRILASPKARYIAAQEGLDLARLVAQGIAQPFHVADLDTLRALPADIPSAAPAAAKGATAQRVTADVPAADFAAFAAWLAEDGVGTDAALASFAAAALHGAAGTAGAVAVERPGADATVFAPQPGQPMGTLEPADTSPALVLRDMRRTAIRSVALGAEAVPVLILTTEGDRLCLTLEGQLPPAQAIAMIDAIAARLADPLRHIL